MRSFSQLILTLSTTLLFALAACAPQPVSNSNNAATSNHNVYVPSAPSNVNAGLPLKTRQVKVALLVPMTGRFADLGRAMQDAASLALYDKYAVLSPKQAATKVEILPIDTGDTPESARAAAQAAVAQGAELILGPIFADAVMAASPVASKAGIQMISFSNNATVARPGTYIFGFAPDAQTDRVVSFALSQKFRVAAIVPNNPLGQQVLGVAKARASSLGASIAPIATYLPQGLGVEQAADVIVKPAPVQEGQPPAKAFDALFIPDVGAPLNTVLQALASRGISAVNTQLLGTGLWDDSVVAREHNLENALLASSSPELTQSFTARFRNAYNYVPPRIASLSYDAVALAVTLATSDRTFDAGTLTSPGGFSGPANGIFRFKQNGSSERGLAVLRIKGGQFQVVSPAPNMFR